MIARIAKLLVLVPLAIIFVLFALANRQVVTLSFDPFGADPPALALTAPLFLVILLTLVAGVMIGGVAAWIGQGKWRRAARRYQADARVLAAQARAPRQEPPTAPPAFDLTPHRPVS